MTESTIDANPTPKHKEGARLAAPITFGALAVVGIACWIAQLTGAGALALTDHAVWGLYIVGFTLCTGIAAGCLMFASSTVLFHPFAPWRPYARLAGACAVAIGAVGAGLFIVADLGSPARMWEMVAYAHPGSPLFWDAIILLAYVVIGSALTLQLVKAEKAGVDTGTLKALAAAALVAGALVAVTSFVFAFQVARPLWNNPGQALSFTLAALVAAGSVLLTLLTFTDRSGYLPISDKLANGLARGIAVALIAELVFVLAETAGGLFAGQGFEAKAITWLICGAGAPFFWAEIACFVAAFVLLLQKARALRFAGGIIAFIAVFLVKYNLVQAELFNPVLSMAGFLEGSGIVSGFYFPSLIEWGVAVGVFGVVCLLLTLAMRKLKLGA